MISKREDRMMISYIPERMRRREHEKYYVIERRER
jgi:hypothetical protein